MSFTTWKHKFHTKLKSNKKKGLELEPNYGNYIKPELKYKNYVVSEPKIDISMLPDSNKSPIEPEQNFDYVMKAGDNNDVRPTSDIKNIMVPESDVTSYKQVTDNTEYKTDTDSDNELGLLLDVNNAMEPGSDTNDDIKQGPNDTDYPIGADDYKILEPPLDVKHTMEPETGVNNCQDDVKGGDVPTGLASLWSYKDQDKWVTSYPHCGLHSQSPVDLPSKGLVAARGARPITFINYGTMPLQLRLKSDGNTVTLQGDWEEDQQPLIYGGAGHSRRYRFHSMTLHAPSEHTIDKLLFPLETQVLHVSTDYATFDDAVNGSTKDHLAFLGIINIYKFGYKTDPALQHLLTVAAALTPSSEELRVDNAPLSTFCPPFGEYASYHGSLTMPPCTESVLWLVRGRALPLEREVASRIKMTSGNRAVQPLNDRRVFLFNKK